MDAQNAAQSSTKQPASPKEGDSGLDASRFKPASATIAKTSRSPVKDRYLSSTKDPQPATVSSATVNDDIALDQNSDAETIVLPGKDGVSPSKPRKVIKHEDKSDEEMNNIPRPRKPLVDAKDADRNGGHSDDANSILLGGRKKRHIEKEKQRLKNSSGTLGSVPTSPLAQNRAGNDPPQRRRRSGDAQSESGSESSKSRSHKISHKDKAKSVERLLPGKRKTVKTESDDDGEMRKARRSRISDAGVDGSVVARERDQRTLSGRHVDKQTIPRNRSTSPPPSRMHRRSISTQLPSQSINGLSNKKRRVPAPLQSTEYHSDDSSASGSPHPRSYKMKNVATPITGESTMSPARMPGHKKHVDNHGQTLFAKACAKGEYEIAKKRLAERPEDLNFADYAGNTPLQVASLNGHEDIVQLLIEAGCNLDCRNSDKETPLLDAVENGHLAVVKLLLKAGVNPRKADAEGHEPLEKVPDDLDNAEEIRAALREAKERVGELHRASEDHQPQDLHDTLSSHGPDSPRDSPAAPINSILAEKRRGGTVRSTKTSNHLLYMNLDDKTLRQAAARGDNETVTRVLQVKERCDDPEALVNAARGGHNLVVELLLALGGANPDPRPVPGLPVDHGTPMLAAIGQENIEVIKLLLNANKFNPTRLYKGQTYYEIARRREGPNWKEEEHMLKEAYDQYKRDHKGSTKTKPSPARRERDLDTDSKRGNRNEPTPDVSRSQKRRTSVSPARDSEPKKKLNNAKGTTRSPREKRRSLSFGTQDEQTSPKRGPGRPKRDERGSNPASSDREISPVRSKNPTMSKLTEIEMAGSSDGETIKPRRKLISGRDLKGQREKQRRQSLASNVSGIDRVESKSDESSEKPRGDREKHLSRTKALKQDESTDRLSTADASGKRHRSSTSPSRRGLGEKEDGSAPVKRRKLDPDPKERRHLEPLSPESRHRKRELSRDPTQQQRNSENDRRDTTKPARTDVSRRESEKSSNSDKSITVASDEPDIEMRDTIQVSEEEGEIQGDSEKESSQKKRKKTSLESPAHDEVRRKEAERELQEREKKKQEDIKQKEQEAQRKRLEAEEQARLEREELKRKEEAEKARLEEERRLKEEEERRRQEELERKQREELEQKQREEQERRQREEQERKQREEEEQRQREEEERIRREAEAAEEEARRIREEQERQQKEREQAERVAREAELQRAREAELERIRVSKLPPLLRWLDGCPNPRHKEIAELFTKAQGVRYDTIDPSATGKPGGRDQWLLNTQVALLLGEKDLSLSRYASWERVPVSSIAKRIIWRLEQDRYALTGSKLYHLGEQLPDLYGGDPRTIGYKKLEQIRGEAADRFLETDMFFVKETDFLHIVPSIPHLCEIRIAICYRELPEKESDLFTFSGPNKWKQDPDAASRGAFAPRNKYYVRGQLVGEEKPGKYRPSSRPPLEHRVPRRHGLVAVTPDEPDYARLCVEQNLTGLLTDQQKQSVLNGSHMTPKSMASNEPAEDAGENISPSSLPQQIHLVNGFSRSSEFPGVLPNGISGDEHH
ncbi:putative histone deacetylase complex subunit [Rosellinia necatrix]|uniref:Putative histone deacetylase complex subunit n=1 Tax=Rosellinia necatrix TaxID=77044 RepID=A0A1W2TRJ0_ROSNE|nr:putative histone deacetylase complex subunit [Rosellinia necatrix]